MKERLCLSLLVSLWKSGPAGWVRKCGMGDPDEPEHALAPSAKTAIEDASLAGGGGDDELLLLLPAATSKMQQRAGLQQVWSQGKQQGVDAHALTLHPRRFEDEEDEVRVSEYPARCRATTRGGVEEGGKGNVIGGGGGVQAIIIVVAFAYSRE